MSKKTIKKRIALVAALALGTGVLSVAPANASVDLVASDWSVATTLAANNYGVCFAGAQTSDATNLVEMTSTGQLKLVSTQTDALTANDTVVFTITGPAVWAAWTAGASTPMTVALNGTQKIATWTSASSATVVPLEMYLKPTGVGTIQVLLEQNEYVSSTSTVNHDIELWTITSTSSCATGVPSAADSTFKLVASGAISTQIACASATTLDTDNANYAANTGAIYVRVDMCDANSTLITETTSLLTAEVSSGAVVGVAGSGTTALAATTNKTTYFKVEQATADKGWAGTITLKLDGVVVSTKSAKIFGAPATIEVSGLDIRQQGAAESQGGDYVIKDAAGNALETAITGFDTFTAAQQTVISSSSTNSRTPSQTLASNLAGTTKGQFAYACAASGPGAVAKGVRLKYTNSLLVSIYSPTFDITCGGAAYTYTASLDKASYVPGDIATLTVSAKDAYGNPVFDGDTLGTSSLGVNIAGSNMTAVNAATYADTFLAGKKEYKFTVGSTEGSYNMVVDLTEFNSASKPQAAIAVPYSVKGSTATVSNADVLKSIVALIASINKQIQALQKLILKR